MITTVVFDLFNTLVHVDGKKTYLKLFSNLGLMPKQMRKARRICMTEDYCKLEDLAQRLIPGMTLDAHEFQEAVELEVAGAEIYPETIDVLKRLRDEGYTIGMISNLASPYKQVYFNFELDKYIDTHIFSCDVGYMKPDPEIYHHLLKRMGVRPEETLMTGDKMHADVHGPYGVGMNAVLLDRSGEAPHSIQSLEGVFDYL